MQFLFFRKLKVVAVAFVAATTFAFGQTYTLVPGDSLVDIAPFNDLTHFTIQQTNISGNPILLNWEQVAVSIPAGWSAFLCDYGFCFTNFPMNGTMDTVSATDYGFLSVGIDPGTIAGTAFVQYAVWDASNPVQKDTLTWIITANGTIGFKENETTDSFSLFPSIVATQLHLKSDFTDSKNYFIINSEGKTVSAGTLFPGDSVISVEHLPDGIYFVSLIDSKNNQINKKFAVKH